MPCDRVNRISTVLQRDRVGFIGICWQTIRLRNGEKIHRSALTEEVVCNFVHIRSARRRRGQIEGESAAAYRLLIAASVSRSFHHETSSVLTTIYSPARRFGR